MTTYRNIDSIVKDTTNCVTVSNPTGPTAWRWVPLVGEEVTIATDDVPIVVKVEEISENKEVYRGTVLHGHYSRDKQSEWIKDGEAVEFSGKKIAGILRRGK